MVFRSREDVLVDQPWNQKALCTYGISGYILKLLRFPVETILKCDAQSGAQGTRVDLTFRSSTGGTLIKRGREYIVLSTARGRTVYEIHMNCGRSVHKMSTRQPPQKQT